MERERWFGVELRHLAALSAVAKAGSFHGAADRLGSVQSAVSQQVAQLERLAGARLVERRRGAKHVHLTEAGELVLVHAEQILAHLHAAQADLRANSVEEQAYTVKVGAAQSVATQ